MTAEQFIANERNYCGRLDIVLSKLRPLVYKFETGGTPTREELAAAMEDLLLAQVLDVAMLNALQELFKSRYNRSYGP